MSAKSATPKHNYVFVSKTGKGYLNPRDSVEQDHNVNEIFEIWTKADKPNARYIVYADRKANPVGDYKPLKIGLTQAEVLEMLPVSAGGAGPQSSPEEELANRKAGAASRSGKSTGKKLVSDKPKTGNSILYTDANIAQRLVDATKVYVEEYNKNRLKTVDGQKEPLLTVESALERIKLKLKGRLDEKGTRDTTWNSPTFTKIVKRFFDLADEKYKDKKFAVMVDGVEVMKPKEPTTAQRLEVLKLLHDDAERMTKNLEIESGAAAFLFEDFLKDNVKEWARIPKTFYLLVKPKDGGKAKLTFHPFTGKDKLPDPRKYEKLAGDKSGLIYTERILSAAEKAAAEAEDDAAKLAGIVKRRATAAQRAKSPDVNEKAMRDFVIANAPAMKSLVPTFTLAALKAVYKGLATKSAQTPMDLSAAPQFA